MNTLPAAIPHNDPFSAIVTTGPLAKQDSPFDVMNGQLGLGQQHQHHQQMNEDRDQDKDKRLTELANPFDLFT